MQTSVIYNNIGRFEVESGLTILAASQRLGLFHGHACGESGSCTSCMVWIIAGAQNCSPMLEPELRTLSAYHLRAPIRLACMTKILGPIRLQILAREENEVATLKNDPKQILPPMAGTQLPLVLLTATVHGFDAFVMKNLPYDGVNMLHQFRNIFEGLLREYNGTLCETNGVGFLAMFGFNEEIAGAVDRAMGCARRLAVACKEIEQYYAHHLDADLSVGIGVHAGETIIGRIGGSEHAHWAVFGETRKIAERLLQLGETAKAKILVSEVIFAMIRDRFPISRAFAARLPGNEQRSSVFEVSPQSTGFVAGMKPQS